MSLKQQLKSEIVRWNNNFPLDYWWRKKYHIPFGSPEHRRMTFVDMYRDFLEEKMIEELPDPDGVEVKEVSKIPQKELDDDFDNLDISKY